MVIKGAVTGVAGYRRKKKKKKQTEDKLTSQLASPPDKTPSYLKGAKREPEPEPKKAGISDIPMITKEGGGTLARYTVESRGEKQVMGPEEYRKFQEMRAGAGGRWTPVMEEMRKSEINQRLARRSLISQGTHPSQMTPQMIQQEIIRLRQIQETPEVTAETIGAGQLAAGLAGQPTPEEIAKGRYWQAGLGFKGPEAVGESVRERGRVATMAQVLGGSAKAKLSLTAELYDVAKSQIWRSGKPVRYGQAEDTFNSAMGILQTNLDMINADALDESQMIKVYQDLNNAQARLNELESTTYFVGKANSDYLLSDGVSIEEDIRNKQRELDLMREIYADAMMKSRQRQQAQYTMGAQIL